MIQFTFDEKIILVQYAIKKFENEEIVIKKLKSIIPEKDIQRNIDTLIGTQLVRRIGPENIQNLNYYKSSIISFKESGSRGNSV